MFFHCTWSCETCGQRGQVRPWSEPTEGAHDRVTRHMQLLRAACIEGCRYTARPSSWLNRVVTVFLMGWQ